MRLPDVVFRQLPRHVLHALPASVLALPSPLLELQLLLRSVRRLVVRTLYGLLKIGVLVERLLEAEVVTIALVIGEGVAVDVLLEIYVVLLKLFYQTVLLV